MRGLVLVLFLSSLAGAQQAPPKKGTQKQAPKKQAAPKKAAHGATLVARSIITTAGRRSFL